MLHEVFDNRLQQSLWPYSVGHTQLSHLAFHAGSVINLPSAWLNIAQHHAMVLGLHASPCLMWWQGARKTETACCA